jgi:hypothetical protein
MNTIRHRIEGKQDETRAPKSWSPGFLLAAVVAAFAAGCGGKAGDKTDPLVEAEMTWAKNKSACGTYTYTRFFSSFGEVHETSVEIMGDVPTRRRNTCNRNPAHAYDEQGPEVGSHNSGAPALTVEQLLAECHELQDDYGSSAASTFVTEIGDRGFPSQCVEEFQGGTSDGTGGLVLTAFACAPFTSQGDQ